MWPQKHILRLSHREVTTIISAMELSYGNKPSGELSSKKETLVASFLFSELSAALACLLAEPEAPPALLSQRVVASCGPRSQYYIYG